MDVKNELKRLHDGRGVSEELDLLAGFDIEVPDGASSILFIHWAAQVQSLFDIASLLGPFLGDSLPIDITDLPDGDAFAEHFPPNVRIGRRVEGGDYSFTRASFGPETWAVVLEGLSSFSDVVDNLVQGVFPVEASSEPQAKVDEPEKAVENEE